MRTACSVKHHSVGTSHTFTSGQELIQFQKHCVIYFSYETDIYESKMCVFCVIPHLNSIVTVSPDVAVI